MVCHVKGMSKYVSTYAKKVYLCRRFFLTKI